MSRLSLSLALALTLACLPRQSGDQSELRPGTADSSEREAVRCAAAGEQAIARLEPSASVRAEAPCGVALELFEGELALRRIPREQAGQDQIPQDQGGDELELLATGPLIDTCGEALERCELWGIHDELGPVLFASERGSESEVPVQVYVGWVEDRRLAFAPTWYGLPAVHDHTRVGPPWALAPHDCEGELVLLPAQRLPEAAVEGPSEALRAAAGRWAIAEDHEAAPVEAASAFTPERCRPLVSALP